MKRFLIKYIDIIFLVFITSIMLLLAETGYLSKFSKFSVVIILAAYYFGKFTAKRQYNAPEDATRTNGE
jgi:L-asparagine transporter-like permease